MYECFECGHSGSSKLSSKWRDSWSLLFSTSRLVSLTVAVDATSQTALTLFCPLIQIIIISPDANCLNWFCHRALLATHSNIFCPSATSTAQMGSRIFINIIVDRSSRRVSVNCVLWIQWQAVKCGAKAWKSIIRGRVWYRMHCYHWGSSDGAHANEVAINASVCREWLVTGKRQRIARRQVANTIATHTFAT